MRQVLASVVLAGFAAAPALAADLASAPVYTKAPMIAPFSWTGCYVGANVGGTWGKVTSFDPVALTDGGRNTPSGVVGGGQVGCDYQFGKFVLGAEGQFDGTSLRGSNIVPGTNNTLVQRESGNWLATATGRLGYALDRNLLYVKGGGAWLNEKVTLNLNGVDNAAGTFTSSGYTIGGGWEWAFAPSWSTKIEYNYLDFGKNNKTICQFGTGACAPLQVNQTQHTLSAGVNYHFNWGGPVVTKY